MEKKINIMVQNMVKEGIRNKQGSGNSKDDKGILEVQNLSAWYGKTLAIKNISMSILLMQIMSIHRTLGCGKSTFIPLPEPDARSFPTEEGQKDALCWTARYLCQRPPTRWSSAQNRHVFQKPAPFPTMSG